MEFPFSFTKGTLAKAAEVMANFNAIKSILEGGLKFENFAAGALAKTLSWKQNAGSIALPSIFGSWVDLLPSGSAGERFTLATKSKVAFVSTFHVSGTASGLSYLQIDGVEYTGDASGVATPGNTSTGQLELTLAAGEHSVRLRASGEGSSAAGAHVLAIITPVE